MRLKPGNDVEALTALYRKIFNFLVVRAGHEPGADRPAEREIAAALESVFPRIGLKAFTALPHDDKVAQLHELAHLRCHVLRPRLTRCTLRRLCRRAWPPKKTPAGGSTRCACH